MTSEPVAGPSSLRVHLRELAAALDEAAAANLAHRQEHGCKEGSGCVAGMLLAEGVAALQHELGMTRFLNEDD